MIYKCIEILMLLGLIYLFCAYIKLTPNYDITLIMLCTCGLEIKILRNKYLLQPRVITACKVYESC